VKLLSATVKNFGSYQDLHFDFQKLGLSLVQGATGSGKSTLADIATWALYGVTAKDGNVDDVRSWLAPDEPTEVHLSLIAGIGLLTVCRIRGKATQNDLYWRDYETGVVTRGKDLTDTQKLLEKRLGVTADQYLIGAYFHEFSKSGLFFNANARDRRAVFEKIATTELPNKLGLRAADAKKTNKKLLHGYQADHDKTCGAIAQLTSSLLNTKATSDSYEETKQAKIEELIIKSDSFEKTKADKIAAVQLKADLWDKEQTRKLDQAIEKIEKIDAQILDPKELNKKIKELQKQARCKECGQPKEAAALNDALQAEGKNDLLVCKRDVLEAALKDLASAENPFAGPLHAAKTEVNNYLVRAEEERNKSDPFKAQISKMEAELAALIRRASDLEDKLLITENKVAKLDVLYDLSLELRGELLQQAVAQVEEETNRLLMQHFDSELKVQFTLNSDDLGVDIQKSGYECSYTQLSKGQRGLLKLCFVLAIMEAAANKAGVHFDNLFLDEALDGLDSNLKVKAYSLLEELSLKHESILVIDHATEFQNLFTRRFYVSIQADSSIIEEQEYD